MYSDYKFNLCLLKDSQNGMEPSNPKGLIIRDRRSNSDSSSLFIGVTPRHPVNKYS